MRRTQMTRGFTLVELLVVIGIIALLISILLPALSGARRAAAQTKCAAQMKQMHNAFMLYAQDNKNYWPPVRVQTAAAPRDYDLYDNNYNTTASAYFYDFASKYLTKAKLGVTSTSGADAAAARNTVVWACPAFDGYASTALGGVNRSQTGIGMNQWPTFKGDTVINTTTGLPNVGGTGADGDDPLNLSCVQANLFNWKSTSPPNKAPGQFGRFHLATEWGRQGANRMLITDSRLYFAESKAYPTDGTTPYQPYPSSGILWTTGYDKQTMVDIYRHGKPGTPGPAAQTISGTGGKIAYNILYCDGHVVGANDLRPAYESVRQRFPG